LTELNQFPDELRGPGAPNEGERGKPLVLVFTDVVGSSAAKRAQSLGADASARDRAYLDGIQSRHLRLVRSAVAEYRGQEIMTIGDSFFLTFLEVVDAIRCSAAIQQRLRTFPIDTPNGPLQLRIGIHAGTPEFFENSWHGTDVDTAARIEAAGSPQQIVLSELVRELAGEMTGVTFRPLGTYALKGIGDLALWDADYDNHGLRKAALVSKEAQRRTRKLTRGLAAVLLVAAVGVSSLLVYQRYTRQREAARIAALSRDSILLADFENKTGDPVFDTTLTQALAIQLAQSPVLNLVSQQHIRQSMRYLGKSSNDAITPAIAREVGEREGVKAFLSGSIAKFGNAYLISVSAQNTQTGDDIASEQMQSPDKEHVLDALDRIATAMRARLGETLSSIQKLDTPHSEATTPSLEAFQAFALGDVEHEKGLDVPQAEGHYKQAVELDPQFAMAWARLGVVANNSGQAGKSIEYYRKAFELSKNISERERLYIDAHYYENVTGELQKVIDTLELSARTYPLDINNPINLGTSLVFFGRFEDAEEAYKRALKLAPDDGVALNDLFSLQFQLDQMQAAAATQATIKRLKVDSGTLYRINKYNFDFLNGDTAAMEQGAAVFEGRPDQYVMTETVAAVEEFRGRYAEAALLWKRAEEQAATNHAPDAEAGAILSRVSGRAIAGFCGDTEGEVKAALAKDHTKPTQTEAMYASAFCDDEKTVVPLLASLQRAYPEDTRINQMYAPQIRAMLALAHHQPAEALHQLEESKPFDLVTWSGYLRGLAYLDLGEGPNAVAAFQSAVKYKGAALNGLQDYPQAMLGLARAYTLAGDAGSARKAYEGLFLIWKDADATLPQLVAARREYAALKKD
jgi:class 3 adenylate cyclase/tetratricopeptide (TPR) repeat protein